MNVTSSSLELLWLLEKDIFKHLSDGVHIFYSRGVLQALIKKQFPAPDGRKVADLFGIDSDASDKMSDRSSPAPERLTPVKRRKKGTSLLINKIFTVEQCSKVTAIL